MNEIASYGRVNIKRAYCKQCKSTAFVKNGTLACCGAAAEIDQGQTTTHRECARVVTRRRKVGPEKRKKIADSQENKCFYCETEFGSVVSKRSRKIRLKIQIDHMVPWAWLQNQRPENLVAACHVCNNIKSSLVFDSLDACKSHLKAQRRRKGYDF